jgi:hypothetical protein
MGRHGAMKPGGSVREVSDMGAMGIGAAGGQIYDDLSAASVFSVNLRQFRRAQC